MLVLGEPLSMLQWGALPCFRDGNSRTMDAAAPKFKSGQRKISGMNEIEIHKGYVPGAIGRVVELHGTYYHAHWEFGGFFEAKVAGGLAEFMNRYDDQRDGL
jgi:hypothetical protein